MKFELLADHPNFLPNLAQWYYDEWGFEVEGRTLKTEIDKLQEFLNKDKIPLILLAIEEGELLGSAQLKFHEMSIYPNKEHWLGAVFVSNKHRGKGIARRLIEALIGIAQNLKIGKLHLQTEHLDGGLYRKMGWEPIEKVNYHNIDVLVMEKNISRHQ